VIYQYRESAGNAAPPWPFGLADRFRPPADEPVCRYLYHDWAAGEFRPVHGVPTGPQSHAVGPHDLAILTPTPTGGTLTLWDLPPSCPPWPWSVPAGVAIGVLLTAAGVRLRRRLAPSP